MATIKKAWAVYAGYLLSASLLACSSAPATNGFNTTTKQDSTGDDSVPSDDSSSDDDSGSASLVNPVSSDGGTGGSSDSGAVKVVDAAPADASWGDTETITLKMADFTVPAGAEVFKCQQVGNPFGKDVDIVSMDGTMATGSHHFFMFDMDATSLGRNKAAPLMDCPGGGLEFHPFPYLSQQPHFVQTLPEGFGYPLNTDHGLMFNVHYLNASSKDVVSHVSLTIKVMRRGIIATHVGTIFMNNTFFSVPPIPKATPQPFTASSTPLLKDFNLMTSWSHMHQWGVDFKATMAGQAAPFYEEKNWDEPQLFQHAPPLAVKGGTSFSWTCSYYNDTGRTLTFGDSAVNNVMCIYFGWYYPADPANPSVVTVLQ